MAEPTVITSIRDAMAIPEQGYYEPQLPYGIFPKSPFLNFSARILKNYILQPCSVISIPENISASEEKKLQGQILIGDATPFYYIPLQKEVAFKDVPLTEQNVIILHELYHLLITYHQLMVPMLKEFENLPLIQALPAGFSNIIDDFIIDAIGTALQKQDTLIKIITRQVELDKFHYFNLLKDPNITPESYASENTDFLQQVVNFLYGNLLENANYPPPPLFSAPQKPLLLLDTDEQKLLNETLNLNKKFTSALQQLFNDVKEIKDKISNGTYNHFWSDYTLLSSKTKNPIILDTVAAFKRFLESIKEIDQSLEQNTKDIDPLACAKQAGMLPQQNEPLPGINNETFTEEVEIIKENEAIKPNEEFQALKEAFNEIENTVLENDTSTRSTVQHIIRRDTEVAEEKVKRLVSDVYPKDIDTLVRQVFHKVNASINLKQIARLAALNRGYLAMTQQRATKGRLNVKEVTKQFPNIINNQQQRPAVYDKTNIVPVPPMKVMAVFDVSGSMDEVNEFLKPFFAKFYEERLSILFQTVIVDFAESVEVEDWSLLKDNEYYKKIRNESGTEPLYSENIFTWQQIVKKHKPDIVVIYTDGEFYEERSELRKIFPPLEFGSTSLETFCNVFKVLGVDPQNVKAFNTQEYFSKYANENLPTILFELAADTMKFLNSAVERELSKNKRYDFER